VVTVAVCGFGASEDLKSVLGAQLGDKTLIEEFQDVEGVVHSQKHFNLYVLNGAFREEWEKVLMAHIEGGGKKGYCYLVYAHEPVSEEKMVEGLEPIRRILGYESMYLSVEFLTSEGFKSIPLHNIIYFEYGDRKVTIRTVQSQYVCSDSLKNVWDLVENQGFYLTYKSVIVNLRHVAGVKGSDIMMSDGTVLPLSQKRAKDFRAVYREFVERNGKRVVRKRRR